MYIFIYKGGFLCNTIVEYVKKILKHTIKFDLKSFKEKIWFYYNNLTEIPTCPCGGKSKFSDRFDKGYNNSQKNAITRRDTFISLVKQKTKDLFI